jgi:hypothetical protein
MPINPFIFVQTSVVIVARFGSGRNAEHMTLRAIYFSEEEGVKGLCPLRGAGCPRSFFSALAPEGGKKRRIK